jgi:hypothetical protein
MRSPWSGPKATQKVAPPMGSARRLLRSLRTVIVLIRHPLQLNSLWLKGPRHGKPTQGKRKGKGKSKKAGKQKK